MLTDIAHLRLPTALAALQDATVAAGFDMASEPLTGALLRTLAASKPGGAFLELGTGTGIGTAWLLAGMDAAATLVTVEQEPALQALAKRQLGHDRRVRFHTGDGADFILHQQAVGARFDLIFADTWPGKYTLLAETLQLLKVGGLYIVDDLLPQPNWPAGHAPKVAALHTTLQQRTDLQVAYLACASGLILATKVNPLLGLAAS